VVLVQQECLKGTYGSSLADWVIASIDDTTGSCASLSVQAKQTLGDGPNMLQQKMVCIHLDWE
jgi:hypothetical protein